MAAVREVQIYFGINADFGRQRNFPVACRERDRMCERCRPAGGEQLLWVGPDARRTGARKPDVEQAELREMPLSRSPLVRVFAVWSSFTISFMAAVFFSSVPG